MVIDFISNLCEEAKLLAVQMNPFAITRLKNPSDKIKLEALKQDIRVLEIIDPFKFVYISNNNL